MKSPVEPLPDAEEGIVSETRNPCLVDENSATGYFGAVVDSEAPIILCDCISFLRHNGLYDVGMFRIPGSKEVVGELKKEYNKEFATASQKRKNQVSILNSFSPKPVVNDVASLLKAYFKELGESIIPEKYALMMMTAVNNANEDEKIIAYELSRAMHQMPSPNREALGFMISFLREVCTFKKFNQMGAENLATCFVLSIMGHGNTVNQLQVLGLGAIVIKYLITMPVRLYMPLLETVQRNTRYEEFLTEPVDENQGDASATKRGMFLRSGVREDSNYGTISHTKIPGKKLRGKLKKKMELVKFGKNGERIMNEPITIADVVPKKKQEFGKGVDFDLNNFERNDDIPVESFRESEAPKSRNTKQV